MDIHQGFVERSMIKVLLQYLVVKYPTVIKPLQMLKNRFRAQREWVFVLGGHSYARELVQQLYILKYKVYLADSAPNSLNWRFASASNVVDVYDEKNIPYLVGIAKRLGCISVLMQSDDRLYPIMAEVNRQLNSTATFSDTAIGATLSKEIMRSCFEAAGMELPRWRKVSMEEEITDVELPCIIKPAIGQGSQGVAYIGDLGGADQARLFIKNKMQQDQCIIEEFLPGRQFNVDGLIYNGQPILHMITQEEFCDFLPDFKPCWYLFGIELTDETRSEISRETREALAAVDFQSGAFHLELKFRDDKCFAFDLANRMAADFSKYERLVHGVALVEDYHKAMHGEPVAERAMPILCSHLRYYNYLERPNHSRIDALAQERADIGHIRLVRDGILLEMTADNEMTLRDFLSDVYAICDNN